MKSDELVRRINNGEIKDGTKIKRYGYGKDTMLYLCGKILRYKETDVIVSCDVLLDNEVEFEIVEEHKGWFEPKEGEKFFWVTYDRQHIIEGKWNAKSDSNSYKNNRFRTRAEAQEYLDYKNALKGAEKPFVNDEENYYITFDTRDNELMVDFVSWWKDQGTIYLGNDRDVARAFIDKWKDEILKYEFGIFE